MYPVALRITAPPLADGLLAGLTRCVSTTGVAFIFSYANRPAPSNRNSATPAMIHRAAHFEPEGGLRWLRSIMRFFSSASISGQLSAISYQRQRIRFWLTADR